jgi:hypothetical protein
MSLMLSMPLAVRGSSVRNHPAYRAAAAASFTAMPVGLVATAVAAAT